MKFLSRNTAGLNQDVKLHQVLRQARQFDFSFLQETKLQHSQAAMVRAKWRSNNIFLSCANTSRRGVLTLVHPRNDPTYLHTVNDPNGQFHLIVVRIRGENYLLCNIYSNPDEDRHAEATMLAISNHMDNIVQAFAIQHTLMAGDFNFVIQAADTTSSSRKPRAEAICNTIINVHDLFDVAALQSICPRHTYFRHRHENTSARYDRFYCSGSLLHDSSYKILPRVSDHAPIQFSTSLTKAPRSWRFSDNLLNDPVFLQGLHNCMRDSISPYADDPTLPLKRLQSTVNYDTHPSPNIFTSLVRSIRKYCMKETMVRKKKSRQREDELVQNLIQARTEFHNATPPTDIHVNNLEAAQQNLLISQSKRAQAAANTNHINYAGFGERMSRYHFG
jgi:exonuclease III